MGKSLSQLEATQAVAVALQRQITDLEQQRDAALKLADRLERFAYYRETDIGAAEYESGEAAAFRESAKYLHTIFATKDGK